MKSSAHAPLAALLVAACSFSTQAQTRVAPTITQQRFQSATGGAPSSILAGVAVMPSVGPGYVVVHHGLPQLRGQPLATVWQHQVFLLGGGTTPRLLQGRNWVQAWEPVGGLAGVGLVGASDQALISVDLNAAEVVNSNGLLQLPYAPEHGPGERPGAPILVGLNRACVGDTLTASGVTSGPRCLEYASGAWRSLSPSSPVASYPFADYSATPLGYQRYLLAFGRGVGNRYAAATEAALLDVGAMTLTRQALGGQAPTPRTGHVAVALNGELFFYGGRDAQGRALGDAYVCNMQSWQCTRLTVPPSVGARFDASATITASGEIALFGGSNGTQPQGDLVLYSPTSHAFRALTLTTAIPARSRAAMVALRDGVELVGGQDASGNWLSDAWWIKVF